MNKMKSLIAVLVAITCCVPVVTAISNNSDSAVASAICHSGHLWDYGCDSNIEWTLDLDGTLTFTGKGPMPDEFNSSPFGSATGLNDRYTELITKVVYDKGITTTGQYMLGGLYNLETVELSDTIEEISEGTFDYCTSLKALVFPDSLKTIDGWAFNNCSSIEEITLPASMESIGIEAFIGCSSLKTVKLPDYVDKLGLGVFDDCTSLEVLEIPGTWGTVDLAFANVSAGQKATRIKNLVLNEGIKEIVTEYSGMISDSLESIIIPESVEFIGDRSFGELLTLKSVTILNPDCLIEGRPINTISYDNTEPVVIYGYKDSSAKMYADFNSNIFLDVEKDYTSYGMYLHSSDSYYALDTDGELTVTSFGSFTADIPEFDAYLYNVGLVKKATVDNGIKVINNGLFYDHLFMSEVTLPDTVTDIGQYAFARCDALKTISLPNSVEVISEHAFNRSGLVSITIPKSVSELNTNVFEDCFSLQSITFEGDTPVVGDTEYWKSLEGLTIYCDEGTSAQQFAEENGIDYEIIQNIPGDCNLDGTVNILDVIMLNKSIFGKYTLNDRQKQVSDVNKDGIPDATDSLMIMKFLVRLINSFDS